MSISGDSRMAPGVYVREVDISDRIPNYEEWHPPAGVDRGDIRVDTSVGPGYVYAPYIPDGLNVTEIYPTYNINPTINPCSEITIYGSQFCSIGLKDHFIGHEELFEVK
jgi:hypothetical protein